jgi:hypothetical protein
MEAPEQVNARRNNRLPAASVLTWSLAHKGRTRAHAPENQCIEALTRLATAFKLPHIIHIVALADR